MATRTKATARDAFELNMKDAHLLVDLAQLLDNRRVKRMRSERRHKIGAALGIPKRKWDELECIENSQVFITLLPGSAELRQELVADNLRPLLRQAIVAACAAVETFVADRAMELYPQAIKRDPIPPRLLEIRMDVKTWVWIEQRYTRRGHGLRSVVEAHLRQFASADPGPLGKVFSIVGVSDVFKRVDAARGVAKGQSERRLKEIVDRRNLIAHTGDRRGTGRATISVAEAEAVLNDVESIVAALDSVTAPGGKGP